MTKARKAEVTCKQFRKSSHLTAATRTLTAVFLSVAVNTLKLKHVNGLAATGATDGTTSRVQNFKGLPIYLTD